MYAVLVGLDFSGKSTLAKKLSATLKARLVAEPFCETIEGKAFKAKLVSNELTKDQEIQGFACSRLELFQKVIGPYTKYGRDVISDRNFICSMVYQSDAAVSPSEILRVNKQLLGDHGFDLMPDLVLFIDIDHEEFLARLQKVESEGREINAKDLMFKDKAVFEQYRNKYLRALDHLVDQYDVNVQILKPHETDIEHVLEIVAQSKELKKQKKHQDKMKKYFAY